MARDAAYRKAEQKIEAARVSGAKVLDLSRIQGQSESEKLTELPESLDLTNNQLTALPESLGQLKKLEELFLHGNPSLGLSADVLGPVRYDVAQAENPTPPSAILAFYFGQRKRSAQPLNEVKLLLVGHGRVGKTSLSKALRDGPHDEKEPETPGIERHPLPIMAGMSKIIAHIWDFGGQEFLHQTHQFFFSERSTYVVVLSGRQGRLMQEAEYWLRLIRTYGTGSPVVIALNQIQSHPFTVDEHFLQENYPEVKAVVKTDCDPRIGIEVLRRLLGKLAGAMPSVRERIDPAWSRVRTHLEEMTESFVTFAGYRVICARNGVATPEKQEALAAILDCLGIALNYREDARLRDTSVLKPRWLVDGIYSSLRWLHKQKTNGEMRLGDFPRALKDTKTYPEAMHQFLLALMEKFELCFPVEDEDGLYLVPALLDANQPRELKKFMMPAARRIQFRYEDVRPPGLLPLFICYAHTNERTVRQLIPSLKVLARRGYVAPWRDADLVPGEDWDETIKERLSNAKVILLMVSRDFLASDYITPQERPLAMSLMEGEKAVVVPVLLSPCSWREEDFARLEKLPRKDEPVSLFSPRENAWVLVEDGIKAAVERARGFSESREFKFRGLPEDRLARGWG